MANLKNLPDPDPELTAAKNLMSRRETLAGAAKMVAGLSIGVQVMAATGADTAFARRVRDVAERADKPGYEDGNGEDEAGGDNFLRVLSPAGRLETFARNDTPLDLHRWEEGKKGEMGRSEWSGSTYSPDGKWLFVHLQYPGRTFAITGPWEKGWA
jgi:hypothetical protein